LITPPQSTKLALIQISKKHGREIRFNMPTPLFRRNLRKLAETRLKEAQILYDNRFWSGSYYLAGYSIECALKACIAKQTRKSQFPDKRRAELGFVQNYSID